MDTDSLHSKTHAASIYFSLLIQVNLGIPVSLFHWVGIVLALIYGQLISDRLPLWLCGCNDGIWKPEYRLHALWIPALIFNPIGLGFFAAALQYHLS